MTNDVNLYLVGGAVRDLILGKKSKDIDFAVEAHSFSHMREWLVENGFEIFVETPRYLTIRARARKDFSFAGMDMPNMTFDFVLCRKDGDYTDGRHPDQVEAGTLLNDLARRDFTVNAIAIDSLARVIDPHNGRKHIADKLIQCVGSPDRLIEDGIRIVRAIRFVSQLQFDMHWTVASFLASPSADRAVRSVPVEQIREELAKAFKADTLQTMHTLSLFPDLTDELFDRGIWLVPTVAKN